MGSARLVFSPLGQEGERVQLVRKGSPEEFSASRLGRGWPSIFKRLSA
jgi:hypothetical protein